MGNWLAHTGMTEPAEFRAEIEAFPADLASLAGVVQGLLMHCDCLALYGLDQEALRRFTRSTLPVRERLGRLAWQSGLSLVDGRPPARREVGTCRDFALLLTSMLRTHGVPARCRCGFASYIGDGWCDHWVCEYWHGGKASWCLADAQLDGLLRAACGVTFDPLDMPRDAFLPANEAWVACRSRRLSPDLFGHGETKGLWFMAVNVARDSLSLNGQETSSWDTWREAPPERRRVTDQEQLGLDAVARHPERLVDALTPPWLPPSPAYPS